MVRVVGIVPYHAASCAGQRFRIELWKQHLAARGVDVELLPFSDERLTSTLWSRGRYVEKALELARCYARQLAQLVRARRPDVVYLYREAALVGPALLEHLARAWRAPIVYDLDEPLFRPYVSPNSGRLNALKFFGKYDHIIALADRVWSVNEAIAAHARPLARRVDLVPMAVDTARYTPGPPPSTDPLRIGWMGTRTSQKNLQPLAAPLARLGAERPLSFRVLADDPIALDGVPLEFRVWSVAEEVPLLRECAIGVVPVLHDEWSPWKFYFKLVQFMALGIPVVASPEGSNLDIVEEGVNGLLAGTHQEWYEKLRLLAEDADLRRELGEKARLTALERFSLAKQLDFVEQTFRELA
jgi:glycosyltransferase involved in cell wall biosynthesis